MAEQTQDQVRQLPDDGSVLGVDIGFSTKRRSSAVCRFDWNATEIRLTIDRFRALEPERSAVLSAAADRPIMVAAFDGPLCSELKDIGQFRLAEQLLTRKLFPFIGKPGQSSSPVGKKLNAAANQCAKIILNLDLLSASVHDHKIHTTAIVEAFPTSFLGLLIDDPKGLSAHRGNRTDIYFAHAAETGLLNRLIEHYLPERHLTEALSTIKNRDDRAAVVCALTALAVAAGDYVAVGDHKHGWMIMPPRSFIQDWAWKLLQQNAQPQGGLEWRLQGRPTAGERLAVPYILDVAATETRPALDHSREAELPKLYAWDEIANATMEWEPKELFEMNREGGWETQGWVENTNVRVVTNGRHLGLETWAGSQEEAEAKFLLAKIFRELE